MRILIGRIADPHEGPMLFDDFLFQRDVPRVRVDGCICRRVRFVRKMRWCSRASASIFSLALPALFATAAARSTGAGDCGGVARGAAL
jgi:hypothetical protein